MTLNLQIDFNPLFFFNMRYEIEFGTLHVYYMSSVSGIKNQILSILQYFCGVVISNKEFSLISILYFQGNTTRIYCNNLQLDYN